MTTLNPIDDLLSLSPYGSPIDEKYSRFIQAMGMALDHHLAANPLFKAFCESQQFQAEKPLQSLDQIPYLPVKIFKNKELLSVPKTEIKTTLYSSATSGIPSSIAIDTITAKRQAIASAKVMTDFLGQERLPFLILDAPPRSSISADLTARSAATLGFLVLARSADYMLHIGTDQQLMMNLDLFEKKIEEHIQSNTAFCMFGFTFILYHHVIRKLKEQNKTFKLPPDTKIVHIGGWKKLENQKVSKSQFLNDIQNSLGIEPQHVIDFYGFTEQMGLIYPSSALHNKITPLYSEIIIRDFQTLNPVPDGQEGLIQILTPIPHSYPGISVLTEDVGRILGRGPDSAGRHGTQFEITGRAKEAEMRGCGDLMNVAT